MAATADAITGTVDETALLASHLHRGQRYGTFLVEWFRNDENMLLYVTMVYYGLALLSG